MPGSSKNGDARRVCGAREVALGAEGLEGARHKQAALGKVGGPEAVVELPAHLVVGRHLALAERGRHVAVGEDDVGEGLGELPVGPAEVGAREVVQAARVDEDCGRKLREALEDVRDALDDRVLKLAVAQVLLGHGDRGEAALQAEFGCAEHDAPEAALGADEDLVAFGHEHAHVHDGPGPARGRRVFEALPEGHGQCASESFAVGAGSTRSGVCAKSRSMGGPQNVKPPRAGSGLVAAQASTRRRASSR